MNILIACQGRDYGQSGAKDTAMRLRDVLRASGMRVFLDAYSDAQVMGSMELSARLQTLVQRADAMILVLEDAHSFYGSRLQEQWMDFETQNMDGLFAVYAMPTLDVEALPQEFMQRYVIFDAPDAMQQLCQSLLRSANAVQVQQAAQPTSSPALQTKQQGAPRRSSQKKQKKERGWITALVLAAVLLATAFIGVPKYLHKREEARIAAEIAAQEEAERLAREQAEYEERQRTMRVRIAEGSTIEQMAAQLEEEIGAQGGEFSADTFLSLCKTGTDFVHYDFIADAAAVENVSERFYVMEGYLFPDTYEIYVHTDERTVIEKMLDRFDEIISGEEFTAALSASGMTLDEVVTLGAVVQKEGTWESFTRISAVFHNRLDIGMMLQSDVTAQYVTGKQSLVMSLDDVSVDSPYNTYVYAGLPAGPICNPGAAAMLAAAAPDTDTVTGGYYYFVLTDPATGVIAYSKTYAEHEAIVNQYAHLWR